MYDQPNGQPNGLQTIADRHGVSLDAVRHLIRALEAGQGRMAQFNHPDLGGFGQWSTGGMTMIGDMFNTGLKARVSALCSELADALPASGWSERGTSGSGWPAEWGPPSTSGSQNGIRYAYFPARNRLAIETDGRRAVYDTEGYDISGVAQQQGGTSSLRFTGYGGTVDLESLRRVEEAEATPAEVRPFVPQPIADAEPVPNPAPASTGRQDDILSTIERLSELHRKGVLGDGEYAAKKAELLARL